MKRIELTKDEKKLLKHTHKQTFTKSCLPTNRLTIAARSLKSHGLIHTMFSTDGLCDARLTDKGLLYKEENPKLRTGLTKNQNKVMWSIIVPIVIGLLIALFEFYLNRPGKVPQSNETNTQKILQIPLEDCIDTLRSTQQQ